MRNDPEVLQTSQAGDQRRGHGGEEVSRTIGKEDTGQDDVKDVVEDEWVFDATGQLEKDGEGHQIDEALQLDKPPGPED